MPTEEEVRAALRSVIDPEVGMNVVDLGLVYGIEIAPDQVRVSMTMTTPACPMGSMITEDAREAIRDIAPEAAEVDVQLVWDPPWSPALMSRARQATLRLVLNSRQATSTPTGETTMTTANRRNHHRRAHHHSARTPSADLRHLQQPRRRRSLPAGERPRPEAALLPVPGRTRTRSSRGTTWNPDRKSGRSASPRPPETVAWQTSALPAAFRCWCWASPASSSAVGAGLLRLGWAVPRPATELAAFHGPLMVSGFFGTVISLERAVALARRWAYLGAARGRRRRIRC